MNLYLLKWTGHDGGEWYDEILVAAPTEQAARETYPCSGDPFSVTWNGDAWIEGNGKVITDQHHLGWRWAKDPVDVTCELIGIASGERAKHHVVITSFVAY